MKFIARKGAPNIPLELIEAQETGNLVFFCGAGVSYAAGLPGLRVWSIMYTIVLVRKS